MTNELFEDTTLLAELILESEEVRDYLRYRKQLNEDLEAQKVIIRFQKLKDRFEEAQRFGRFHPNFHEAKQEAQLFQKEMYQNQCIKDYVESEKKLDKLLFEVSRTLAHAVSEEIMVPNDDWNRLRKKCNCKG